MKPFKFISGRPAAAIVLALLASLGMSACGSGNYHYDANSSAGPPASPAPVHDAYFAAVSGIVSASSDSTAADGIDTFASTGPEDTEPESLG